MSRPIFLALIFIALLQACDTENNLGEDFKNTFIKYYGDEGNQFGVDLVELDEGGFVLLGRSISTDGNSQILLTRVDEIGNELWSKTYGGVTDEFPTDLEKDASGNFIFSANVSEANASSSDILIFKTDNEGNKLDSVVLGFAGFEDVVNDIIITTNQDIITIGSTEATDSFRDILAYRLTTDLSQVDRWETDHGFANQDDIGQRLEEDENGNITFFASTNAPPQGNVDKAGFNFYVFKTNDEGNTISFEEQFYGTSSDQFISSIAQTLDGGRLIIGSTQTEGNNRLFVTRTRSNFDSSFEVEINSTESIQGIDIVESSSGILITGNIVQGSANNIYLSRLNSSGIEIWSTEFGGEVDNGFSSKVIELADGSIIVLGSIELESQTKMALIKVNRSGSF